MVDSNDEQRIAEAREELITVLANDELRDAILLVFANKMDLPKAMSISEMNEKLGLNSLKSHKWFIQNTCAINGEGLYEALEWLSKNLKNVK